MPETNYFTGIDVVEKDAEGNVIAVLDSADVKDSEARADLADLEEYVETLTGFTRTVLYDSGSYTQYAPFQTDVNLSDNLSKYDMVMVMIGTAADNVRVGKYECDTAIFDVPLLMRNDFNAHYAGYYQRWMDIKFTDTTFNILNSDAVVESSDLKPCIYMIIGYKWG